MDKRANIFSQIYLLSLDTFMIMTVLGITLGIIFFILNPTLNKGIISYEGEKVPIDSSTLRLVSTVLSNNNYDFNGKFCRIPLENNQELTMSVTPNKQDDGYQVFFKLKKVDGETIKISLKTRRAIEQVGLGFLL